MSCEVVMLAGPFRSTAVVYNFLRSRFKIGRVIVEAKPSRWQMLRNRARKLGLARVVGQFCFRSLAVPYLRLASKSRLQQIDSQFQLDLSPIPDRDVTRLDSVNSAQCVALLRELQPRAIVVHGTRILSPEVLSAASGRFINLHAGITPAYRGVHGAYWALAERQPQLCGVTVHIVDEGVDTGAILAQALISPGPGDNFATYERLQLASGLPLLEAALRARLNGHGGAGRPIDETTVSKLWTHPTLTQYLRNRWRLGVK
jgi:folate-dependent phosphoribosylglycinamide formyltransferase PurN